jgi:hypothetical protein
MNLKESPEAWTPPELIVLVRNKPEEALLVACKGDGSTYVTSWVQNSGCFWWESTVCDNLCSAQASS